jgi:hypothetical protein
LYFRHFFELIRACSDVYAVAKVRLFL